MNCAAVPDGVYVSNCCDPAGPWNKIADVNKLANSGSALKGSTGYQPGVQAWYNQYVLVDPKDANHVYVGLEETFETRNGGSSWGASGPPSQLPRPPWPSKPPPVPPPPPPLH